MKRNVKRISFDDNAENDSRDYIRQFNRPGKYFEKHEKLNDDMPLDEDTFFHLLNEYKERGVLQQESMLKVLDVYSGIVLAAGEPESFPNDASTAVFRHAFEASKSMLRKIEPQALIMMEREVERGR